MDVRRFIAAQTNRYSAAVRKLLSIKGEEHDVSFGVHIEDERPEFSFVKGERLWITYQEVTSAAGTLSLIGVQNPPASGVLCVVTNIWALVTASASVRLVNSLNAAVFGGAGPLHLTDSRFGVANGTSSLNLAATAAAVGGTAIFTEMPLTLNIGEDFLSPSGRVPPVVLGPASALYLGVTAVGVNTLKAMFAGYERSLESGELV